MKVNFSFDDTNVNVTFENNYTIKDTTTEKEIKILMLKGEKGDPGSGGGGAWGEITGNINNQTDLKNALDNKADTTDIPDVSDFITNTVNDLVNYYKKTETYTQTEINSLISAIPKFAIQVVASLPTTDISTTTIYLVTTGAETQNLYTEYIYVNSTWEKLGTQTVDLSNYYTKTQVDTLISNIDLSNYYTKTQVDTLISNIDLSSYYTKTQTDTLLSSKVNISDIKDNLTSTDTNKPLSANQGRNLAGHILWTNSDTSSDFGAQTVNLNDTDYDFIKIIYKYHKSLPYIMSQETLKNYGTVLGASFTYASQAGGETVMRTVVSASSGAQLTFREGKQQLGSTESTNNAYAIPIYVIGYKLGLFS